MKKLFHKKEDKTLEAPKKKVEIKTERKKTKKVRWLTRSMAEEFSRGDVLRTTLKEALLYTLFVIAVTICTIGRRTSSMFYITQALKGQFLNKEFSTSSGIDITFEDIKTPSDFWDYAGSLMIDSFYWEHYASPYDPVDSENQTVAIQDKKIIFENKLLGVPRIRQVKVKEGSCEIHTYFRKMFRRCYDQYTEENEDKDPFGFKKGAAWTWRTASETRSVPFEGTFATYGGGGFYHDLAQSREGSAVIIDILKNYTWITRGTRAVFVDFSIYNANLNLFCICKLIFEFTPTGGINPSHFFQAVHLVHYVDKWDYVTFAFEIMVYVMAGFYLFEETREIIYFKFRYFLQFWSYIDCTIIGVTIANLFYSIILVPDVNEAIKRIRDHPERYANLEDIGAIKVYYNNFAASLLFFTYVKLFKYLNFNKTMGQLNNTLKRCALDILGFSIMFFIIFFAFAELGLLLFGSQVEDFSSFGIAMFTLLRTILGDFDYRAIEEANRILAPLYFLSYIFFNMFLAIINDTYADVKTEIAIVPDEMQMTEFLKKGLFRWLRKWGCNLKIFKESEPEVNATLVEIRSALKKCGFSDLEIEMFFARYNIDPLAEVGDYDAKKIMKELEGESMARQKLEESGNVRYNDFVKQQEQLERIENTIQMLGSKVDNLVRKLLAMDSARRNR